MAVIKAKHTLIRVRSHRSRMSLVYLLGYLPQGYFVWDRPGEYRECPDDKLQAAMKVKGITRARVDRNELRAYWSFGDDPPRRRVVDQHPYFNTED